MNTKNIIIETFKADREYFSKMIMEKCFGAETVTPAQFLPQVMTAITSDAACIRFNDLMVGNIEFNALYDLVEETIEVEYAKVYSRAKSDDMVNDDRKREMAAFKACL